MQAICPHCHNSMEWSESSPDDLLCPSCGSSFRLDRGSTVRWTPKEGQRELGRFELIDIVGTGGFGTVYKARDPELQRIVAIKVPRGGSLLDGEHLDRFLREARSVAQLRHPSIVSVHEVGQLNDVPYLVSDFVQGVTLADSLTGRRPSPHEAARLIATVADALQYAHQHGVTHRDVKPSNIMLADDGTPYLMDFGLAKRDAGETTMTMDGQVLGTPAYMSPEQARGEGHRVDGRSDVYSLGVILYELLTGELPFRGNTRMLLHQVLHDEPKGPRSLNDRIPRDLETVCLKAMAKESGKRYQTAAELADDLRRFLNGRPVHARPTSRPERWWRWCRRNPVVAGLATAVAGLLVLTAVGAAIAAIRFGRLATEADDARLQEHKERRRALALAEDNRLNLYAARINLAHQSWQAGDVGRVLDLLDSLRPRPEQTDLRGFEWDYLWRLCHTERRTLHVHTARIRSLAFAPDDRVLAVAGNDPDVKLWDVATGQEQGRL
ncbi:MAG TPA: serine/threonine-protein kinase, partial [Gemmataceae bacterium]|nr:serine/threonine-protein kinase [Gemmataceae bacterium]